MLNERRIDELKHMSKDELIVHISDLEGIANNILNDWDSRNIDNLGFVNRMFKYIHDFQAKLGQNGRN